MYSIYQECLKEYEDQMGEPFDEELYPNPASVPPDPQLLKLVSKIKFSHAQTKKTNLFYKMQKHSENTVFIETAENRHLVEESNELDRELALWDYSHL